MNLESAELKAVNSSKPQLEHTPSKRSASASEDFFSDYASDASSNKTTSAQYETPPSRASTPAKPHNQVDSEMTLPARPLAAERAPLETGSSSVARKPLPPSALDIVRREISPGVDDSPFIRFAIEQLTRDEEILGVGRRSTITSADDPINSIIGDGGPGHSNGSAPPSQSPNEFEHHPPPSGTADNPASTSDEVLLPVAPPEGTQWPDLGFVPIALRPLSLILLIIACLLMMAGLIFSNVYSKKNNGLYDYDGTGTPRYFVFQFLPQLLGVVIIVWLFVLQGAICRILPFLIMASNRPFERVLQDVPILPANFLFPHLVHFRVGEPLVGSILFVFWISNFTVPLLSCAYQTELFSVWRWTSVQGVAWTLVALYAFLILALVLCAFRFRSRNSALKWDPVSLADLIPLFQKSNMLHLFEQSEISPSVRGQVSPRLLRFGYWTTSTTADIFHGVGEENAPVRPRTEDIHITEKIATQRDSDSFDVERLRYSDAESFTRQIHSPFTRYRWAPWFLRDSAVLSWVVFAVALTIAFIVVSFLHSAVQYGFDPRLLSGTNLAGFSSSNFLYSFLPASLGMFLFLAWQPIDTYFRAVQPFVNLSHPKGATAEHSLLLSYPSCYPIESTILALVNRDLKVAWISFVNLMSAVIPVLAGGVFTAQYFRKEDQIRVAATMPAYNALVVFVAVYAASLLVVWPKRKRYLPHRIHTLADLLSFIYQSRLLTDPMFREVKTKADLVGRLVVPAVGEETGRHRGASYAFGIYIGRDGREHLGIDRLQRPGSGEMLITTGMMR